MLSSYRSFKACYYQCHKGDRLTVAFRGMLTCEWHTLGRGKIALDSKHMRQFMQGIFDTCLIPAFIKVSYRIGPERAALGKLKASETFDVEKGSS